MINADDMQSWAYLLAPTFQFVNTAGKPLTEGWIEVYIAGTRDKYYCASDFNGTLHPFQIPLDSLGANIVLADPDQAYDVYVYNKYGSLVMSRYHVSPGMTGGSGVLNITITSEDGTVSVNNDGNGNFDLSIQDTIDRIDVLEQTVSGLSSNSSVGYAIAHAYTVELDGSFDLINDAVTGIGYTPNMDGFRLKSGHVYQFNFNALFENGAFDRNCSGKLYLEGPNTIAQEWKFDLDDSYYHSQSINGSTVLVTPNDLNYYDVKLKLAWDVDYPNKPNVDLNKISIVDITTILSTTVSGIGGDYTGGDGIFVNDETYVISVDMDYINSHLNIDASEIIASAVNIATAYTDARVTSASGDLVNLIAEVSASIPTGTVTQVQSDWTEQDSSSPAYIQHKPDLSVYATNASLTAVSSVLQTEIDSISGTIPEQVNSDWNAVSGAAEILNKPDLSIYATNTDLQIVSAAIPDVSEFATHTEVSGVSSVLNERINTVSGAIITYQGATGVKVEDDTISLDEPLFIQAGHNVEFTMVGDVISINAVQPVVSGYATHNEVINTVSSVSSVLQSEIEAISAVTGGTTYTAGDYIGIVDDTISVTGITDLVAGNAITITASGNSAIISSTGEAQVQSDWNVTDSTSKAYIKNKPRIPAAQIQSDWNQTNTSAKDYIKNKPTIHTYTGGEGIDITNYTVSLDNPLGLYAGDNVTIEVSGTSAIISAQVPSSGFEYGQFYSTAVSGAATMAKAKGNIDVTNDGKIILKQGQSYHVTVRGRYNQSTPSDDYGVASYIEYITNNSINISVDKSRTDSQFFELSYDLYKLNSDTNYYVFFTLNNAVINDLFIDIHSITGGGSGSGGGGSSPEYDAGYGIQILNNVISVSGIAPQIQSDWNQTNTSSVDYIKNKPEEAGLIAGDNISITASGNNFIISSTASGGSSYQAGYGIDITGDTISVVSSIIPDAQINSDWTATSGKAEILNKPNESELIAGDGVSITASGSNYIISAAATGYVTESQLQSVSGILETEIQTVSAAIPTVTLQSLNTANVSDIQIVNAPSACTGANILYLIPEA